MGIFRLLLALSVLAMHCGAIFGLRLVGGEIAVQSFFIISGFYMSLILHEKYIAKNNSYRLFITNRFFRLYPLYWTVLLLTVAACIFLSLATGGQSSSKFGKYVLANPNIFSFSYLVLTNIIIFGQDLIMFLGINPTNGGLFFTDQFMNSKPPLFLLLFVPQAWTLAMECMFYLIAPAIVRRSVVLVASLIASSFLLRLVLYYYYHLTKDPWTFRFFPTELMFFLLGYFSYKLYLKIKDKNISLLTNATILVFMCLFTVFYFKLPLSSNNNFPFTATACFYFLCVTACVPFLFNFTKTNKIDRKIGELSYPVYISHFLVSMVIHSLPFSPLQSGWVIAIATIGVSMVLNKHIASPVEKFRQSRLE